MKDNNRRELISEYIRIIEELGAEKPLIGFIREGSGFFTDAAMVEVLKAVKKGRWTKKVNKLAIKTIQSQ